MKEGTVKKGGQNTEPTTPRPSPPQGQAHPSEGKPPKGYVEGRYRGMKVYVYDNPRCKHCGMRMHLTRESQKPVCSRGCAQ